MLSILKKIASLLPLSIGLSLTQTDIILPFYHTISDEKTPHIKHLYRVKNRKEFEKDIDFLCQHFQPIDYPTFCKIKKGLVKPKKRSFLLSFDDGLAEFYHIIAPILKKKNIPAVCFLNSAFIDNKDLFYRYKASLLIDFLIQNPKKISCTKFENIDTARQQILAVNYQNRQLLDNWAKQVNYSFSAFLEEQKPYLTTEQIKELQQQGFYFGAHLIDHPEYFNLPLKEQIQQTKESVEKVQKEFNIPYKIFAFPFTDFNVSKKFFDTIKKEKICDATFGTAGIKKDTVSNNYQRIPLENSDYSAKKSIKIQLLFSLIKRIINRNKIIRK